jgi:hypothetical protein
MPQKQINLKSTQPIILDAKESLKRVNELRAEKGNTKKGRAPITIDDFVAATKVLEDRSATFGLLELALTYLDTEGVGCIRYFPNFGLEVVSRSEIKLENDKLLIIIELTVKAGRKKWQVDEVQECIPILTDKNTKFSVQYRCDETTDPAGYSRFLVMSDAEEKREAPLNSFFEITSK